MVHKGEIIQKAVKTSGFQITKLASKLRMSRRNVYNIFEKDNVDIETIEKIGKIINYDFSKDFKKEYKALNHTDPELAESSPQYLQVQRELEQTKIECESWKNKYIQLLENYNKLLLKKN